MAPKPIIVLVPGAWHCPEHYSLLTDALTEAGYQVKPVTLPSVGHEPAETSNAIDVEAVRSVLSSVTEAGNDVLIVGHSYGGSLISEAGKGFTKQDRAAQGLKGGIVASVYVCAFAPDVGESMAKWVIIQLELEPANADGTLFSVKSPLPVFYSGVETELAQKAVAMLKPHPPGTWFTDLSYALWKHVPSTYILCTKDQTMGVQAQENMTAPERGGNWNIVRFDAGHSPFLENPKGVAKIIHEAAVSVNA